MDDNAGMGTDETTESSVITTLRKQLKEAEARASEWDEARKEAAGSQLAAAGFPKLADVFLSKVDGIATPEKVSNFLTELGLAKTQEEPKQAEGEKPAGNSAEDLAKLSGLGQQVASAATGEVKADLQSKILAAANREELNKVMAEAGVLSHE